VSNNRTTHEQLIGKDEEGNGLAYRDVIYRQWPGRSEEGDKTERKKNYLWPIRESRTSLFL
jgi:hypothetical protein